MNKDYLNYINIDDFNILPEELYHYTTVDNFYKIIESNTLRFCDVKKMNDSNELFFAKKAFENVILKSYEEDTFDINLNNIRNIEALKYILNSIFNSLLDLKNYFAFCMTEEKDMLEQWLEYSNKGIGLNFSFNKEMLLKFLCKYKIKLMKIKYISLEDLEIKFKNEAITFLKILKAELLNEDFNYFSEYINIKLSMNQKYEDFKSRIKYHKLINILSKPLQNIQSYCYMYKQLEFKQENEWRLIIIEDNIENHDYFIKNDDFIAFKTYNYDFKYINEITLGPKNKININDIYRYLYKKGVDSCFDCKKSKINYR